MSRRLNPFHFYLATGITVLLVFVGGFLILSRISSLERHLNQIGERVEEVGEQSRESLRRANQAEDTANQIATQRDLALSLRDDAQQEAELARWEAANARRESEELRAARQQEMDRLHQTLDKIVETRRTALGLVMSLESDSVQFDFDRAELRPENRELLSRIAGILLTSDGYGVYVYGHTDDVGTEDYNQELSERRAQSVRDYLVEAGIDPGIISTRGFGKTRPRIPDASSEARAKNRRVEIGIIDTRVQYDRPVIDGPR